MNYRVREDWYEPRPDDRVLRETLARLERGWVQHALSTGECWCLVGALYESILDLKVDRMRADELIFHLSNRIGTRLPRGFEPKLTGVKRLIAFNDTRGRTQAEVVNLVRQALAPASGPSIETRSSDLGDKSLGSLVLGT